MESYDKDKTTWQNIQMQLEQTHPKILVKGLLPSFLFFLGIIIN